jgi:hypothetical protein
VLKIYELRTERYGNLFHGSNNSPKYLNTSTFDSRLYEMLLLDKNSIVVRLANEIIAVLYIVNTCMRKLGHRNKKNNSYNNDDNDDVDDDRLRH